MYSEPDAGLLEESFKTIYSCQHGGESALEVVDCKAIKAVVAMIPHEETPGHAELTGRVYVMEKPGLYIMRRMDEGEDREEEGEQI